MKASELRIGNLVYESVLSKISRKKTGVKICELNSLKIHHVESFPESEYYSPIPLTEEWLMKFGFEKAYETCYQYKDFILNDKFIMMDIDITIQLKHVNQLQNLYFALTGEEL